MQQLEAERARFVQAHLGELAQAKEAAAHAARERAEKSLEEVEEAARG